MKTDPRLWSKLAEFRVDRGSPDLSFVQRLARENRWGGAYSRRVFAEYLRFLYLAGVSKESVTPSADVDQAWHLHLCYTRSYWNDLCQRVLPRPLHHAPTEGGAKEGVRFHSQYEDTLRLYRLEFGHLPPEDIWPPSAVRFESGSIPAWTSPDRFYVVDKRQAHRRVRACLLISVALVGAGAAASGPGVEPTVFVAVVVFLVLVWWIAKRARRGGKSDGGGCGTGCSGGSNTGCGGDSGCGSSGCGGCGGD